MSHLYIHIPFCAHRCGYCDFVSSSRLELIPQYLEALYAELRLLYKQYPWPLKTIYIGGGTPSVLNESDFSVLLEQVKSTYGMPSQEWTVEMNPETVTPEKIASLVKNGVNRVSLGMQAKQPHLLQVLERNSRFEDVEKAVSLIKQAGIPHVSLDLIYGIPGQTLSELTESLEAVLGLDPDHISTYALKLEPQTPMGVLEQKGLIELPLDDLVADQLDLVIDTLVNAGYERYEVSNFAKGGCESKHNLAYWHGCDTLGAGMGAVYLVGNTRYENHSDFQAYFASSLEAELPIANQEKLEKEDLLLETLMLELRLAEGVCLKAFEEKFDMDFEILFERYIAKYIKLGLMAKNETHVYLTRQGMGIENAILVEMFDGI